MANIVNIQNGIVGIINIHHTIPPVPNDDDDSISTVEYNYEARVFYTDDNNTTTTMINYFRINEPCNFKYFKSELGWEQKNDNGNYVPVKYGTGGNIDNNDTFIYRNQNRHDLDNGASESLGTLSYPAVFSVANIENSVDIDEPVADDKIRDLGLKLANDNISTKKFFSVVTPKNGANNLTTICGFHTADNANELKIQFFDTSPEKYILKYKARGESETPSSMTLILCKIRSGGGGGKRKKKTPSARSKKRSKTSQTKTLKKH